MPSEGGLVPPHTPWGKVGPTYHKRPRVIKMRGALSARLLLLVYSASRGSRPPPAPAARGLPRSLSSLCHKKHFVKCRTHFDWCHRIVRIPPPPTRLWRQKRWDLQNIKFTMGCHSENIHMYMPPPAVVVVARLGHLRALAASSLGFSESGLGNI